MNLNPTYHYLNRAGGTGFGGSIGDLQILKMQNIWEVGVLVVLKLIWTVNLFLANIFTKYF
ncbi:hypothetical protein G9Q97_01030 [Cyclobacterium sp. GBPx2]|uniref:Uncharacterized protein n=1 Tax=Cyclobacterium plantarum TaxID=2716263 RepID=A0ABX0H4B7_9BACT|nr:hypothetical protein [Cyclobacterium plantarum]